MQARSSPWWTAIFAALFMVAVVAQAQLSPCTSSTNTGLYKIFVDDVKSTSSAPIKPALQKQMSGLRDFIVENLRTMSKGRAFVVPCSGRFPGDASVFTDDEFESLDNLRVLLEVWGSVDDPVAGRGTLGFVLVPARSVAPPALFVVRRSGKNFLAQAQQGAVLEMFAPIAIGIHDYQNRKFEDAVPNLCEGIGKLQDVVNIPTLTVDQTAAADQKKLLIELQRLVNDAIKQARTNPQSRYQLSSPSASGQFSCPTAGGAL